MKKHPVILVMLKPETNSKRLQQKKTLLKLRKYLQETIRMHRLLKRPLMQKELLLRMLSSQLSKPLKLKLLRLRQHQSKSHLRKRRRFKLRRRSLRLLLLRKNQR